MADLLTVQNAVALLTLTILEIVLGVDNIIFLAIVTQDVPRERQNFVRRLGLSLALIGRIGLVLGVSWLLGLESSLFTLLGHAFSVKDLILLAGGLFLTTRRSPRSTRRPSSARKASSPGRGRSRRVPWPESSPRSSWWT